MSEDTDNVSLRDVIRLAHRQLELEDEITNIQDRLTRKTRELDEIRYYQLPEVMAEAGLTSFRLDTGEVVNMTTDYRASLVKYKGAAIEWLHEIGEDDLVYTDLTLKFSRGEKERMERASKILEDAGLEFSMIEDVNTGTFKALVREKMENGMEVPIENIGVTVADVSKIKRPKE